jgi:hypothetical protein
MKRAAMAGLLLTLAACGGSETSEKASPLGPGHEELEAGVHRLDLVALDQKGSEPGPASLPKIEITVPEGWFNYQGASVGKGNELPQKVFVFFWDVAKVYSTPCKWKGKPMVDPGPDVDGLAAALAAQPLRNASAPNDVELAGYHGKYLELSVPSDIDFGDCDEGVFESWTANGWGSDRYQQSPGQVDRIWVLDVDGERLLVDASYLPEANSGDRAELESVVHSIRFFE